MLTLLVVCLDRGHAAVGLSARTWFALLGLGLISQLGAYLALAYALGHLPATITSVGLLAQVPLTALLAVPLLGEPSRRVSDRRRAGPRGDLRREQTLGVRRAPAARARREAAERERAGVGPREHQVMPTRTSKSHCAERDRFAQRRQRIARRARTRARSSRRTQCRRSPWRRIASAAPACRRSRGGPGTPPVW